MGALQVELQDLVTAIVSSLVDHPSEVRVTSAQGESCTMLEVHVNKDDIGKVIGRQGHTASAIRTILSNAAGKHRTRVILDIAEPNRRRAAPQD